MSQTITATLSIDKEPHGSITFPEGIESAELLTIVKSLLSQQVIKFALYVPKRNEVIAVTAKQINHEQNLRDVERSKATRLIYNRLKALDESAADQWHAMTLSAFKNAKALSKDPYYQRALARKGKKSCTT